MDNFTHSLVGGLIAEVAYSKASQKNSNKKVRLFLHGCSFFANNFPDSDLIMQLYDPTLLGYMLNHRGYTHTLIGLLFQFFILFSFSLLFQRWKGKGLDFQLTKISGAVIFAGLIVHLLLDYTNPYGVHPFWPWQGAWYYGDFAYIISPILWVLGVVFLYPVLVGSKWLYFLLVMPLVACIALYKVQAMTVYDVAFTLLLYLVLFLLVRKSSFRSLSWLGLALIGIYLLSLSQISSHVKKRIRDEVGSINSYNILDISVVNMPTNVRCWPFLSVQEDNHKLIIQAGVLSLWGQVGECIHWSSERGVKLDSSNYPSKDYLKWEGQFELSINDFQQAVKKDCRLDAWTKFARIPHYDSTTHIYNDLRFALKLADNFSTLDVQSNEACPPHVPNWQAPLNSLLEK